MSMRVSVILALLVALISADAAEYEYVPLVREGVQWYYLKETAYPGIQYCDPIVEVCEITGDSTVNGVTYKKVYRTRKWRGVVALIREENKKVFILSDGYPASLYYDEQTGEYLIYDFNKWAAGYGSVFAYFYSGVIEIQGKLRRAFYHVRSYNDPATFDRNYPDIIEGIGIIQNYAPFYSPRGLPGPEDESQLNLTHVSENGEIVYKTRYYNDYEYFVRTGKALSFVDVNSDHNLNVADVSALYSIILNESRFIDINGDNKMNVADVSALYSIIME